MMSAERAQSLPTAVRSSSLDRGGRRSLLNELVVEHGPRQEIARRMLVGDTALREHGIVSSFCSIEELCQINRANPESWSPLVPLFDPAVSDISEENAYAVVGRDANGRAVYAMAARIYALGADTLKAEIESLKLFYRDPAASAWEGEAINCTAPAAARMTGNVCFTGAAWVHPSQRGRHLQHLFRPIGRMINLTRWNPDYIVTFMAPNIIDTGAPRKGQLHLDMEVEMINTPVKRGGVIHAGLAWLTNAEQAEHVTDYYADRLAAGHAEVDGGIVEAAPKKQIAG